MRYHNISYPDMNNGSGLRVVLWLSGCSHHCNNCQNPQTWNPDSGIEFDLDAKEEIFEQLNKDYISGITFSGGDPLYENNVRHLYLLLQEIRRKFPQKTIWLYTGFTFEEIMLAYEKWWSSTQTDNYRFMIMQQCDVLVDGRYEEDKKSPNLPWVGSSNQRVIDIQQSLEKGEIILWHTN